MICIGSFYTKYIVVIYMTHYTLSIGILYKILYKDCQYGGNPGVRVQTAWVTLLGASFNHNYHIRKVIVIKMLLSHISKPTVFFRVLVPAGASLYKPEKTGRIQLTKLGIWTHKTISAIVVSQHLVSLKSYNNLGSILVYIHDILHTRNGEWADLWAEQDVSTSPAVCHQAQKPRKAWEDRQKNVNFLMQFWMYCCQ